MGRESHATADCNTGDVFFVEPYEGKTRIQTADFVAKVGSNPANEALRCVRPYFGSGRCVLLDYPTPASHLTSVLSPWPSMYGLIVVGNVIKTAPVRRLPQVMALDKKSLVRGHR